MMLLYRCPNEACRQYEDVVEIRPGQTAECAICGWFMEAVDGGDGDGVV